MIDVRIGFKNGTTLQIWTNKFEVVKDSLGGKSYRWNVAGLNTHLEDIDLNEVLWVTTSGHRAQEEDA